MEKTLKISFLTIALASAGTCLHAQNMDSMAKAAADTTRPMDGFYKQNPLEGAKPFQFPAINVNNVRFYKRIWRDIDLQYPKNRIFATPGASLMDIILAALQNGKLTAYDASSTKENPTGDAFVAPLTYTQAMSKLTDSVLVPQFDENGNQTGAVMKLNDFNSETVTKFRIKEDIFFDRQRSRVETRIVGLAPLIKIKAGGELVSEQPAFWLYFPQCRYVFATKQAIDAQRDIYNVSFDDIFIQHNFYSQIVKESNPGELSIKDYMPDSLQQAQESIRLEQQIKDYKKKTWQY
ncbi:MAG: gliding motility protein GldN [Flavipsychrobacter sp.]|nr:gliding motility protein GldN [Flavipsychrobacter sp.]